MKRVPLGSTGVFRSVDERDLARLEALLPPVRWPSGEEMPAELASANHLFLVREGRLAVLGTTPSGHRIMIALLERGASYSTLGDTPAPRAVALQEAAVSAVPVATLLGVIKRYPQVGIDLAEALSERVALLREVVAVVGEIRVEDRLRARLQQLALRLGVATREGAELRLDLTHAQWALLVGASRESVTLAFGRLKAEGAVSVQGRVITIPWRLLESEDAQGAPAVAAAV